MQFESRNKRNLWVAASLWLIIDFVIAITIAKLIDFNGLWFLLIFIAIQIIYLFIWVKNSILSWIVFFTVGRKTIVKHIFDFLSENNFPEPNTYQESTISYLNSVANNDELPKEMKFFAAAEIGVLAFLMNSCKIQENMRLSMAYEDAIEQYKKHLITLKRNHS